MINWNEWRDMSHRSICNSMNCYDDPYLSKYYNHLTNDQILEVILMIIVEHEQQAASILVNELKIRLEDFSKKVIKYGEEL